MLASTAGRFSSITDQSIAIAAPSTPAKNKTVNSCVTAFPLYYPQGKTPKNEKVSQIIKIVSRSDAFHRISTSDRNVDFGDQRD
jgi:hypothetical protein